MLYSLSWTPYAKPNERKVGANRPKISHLPSEIDKRTRNLRAALERIIERVDDVQVNAAAIVQAVATLARINTQGQLVEPRNRVTMHDVFDRMSPQELEIYAKDGTFPDWFYGMTGATNESSHEDASDEKTKEK